RSPEEEAVELVRLEGDRGDERDAGLDELLRLGERAKLRHFRLETVRRRIRGVERPVAGALVVVVEGPSRGEVDPGIDDVRIVALHVGVLRRRGAAVP